MRNIILLFLIVLNFAAKGQSFLQIPIEGKNGVDYTIVNYVDWSIDSIYDSHCGSKSYNGHQGTDFVIRSFKQMDSGVFVLAASNGIITFTKDGEFDREKESVISKKLGNYICIKHPNKYYSYYAHLKKNSLLVKAGDSVVAGQKIALVASSGNSTDPHLHFELWYDSSFVVDPFSGPCGNSKSLWVKEPNYDTSFQIWAHGLHNDTLSLDKLRERELSFPMSKELIKGKDSVISIWSHMYGLRKGDSLKVKWINSKDIIVKSYTFYILQDWWYYYFWTHIEVGDLKLGKYKVVLEKNGSEIVRNTFSIGAPLSISKIEYNNKCNWDNTKPKDLHKKSLKLYNINGSDISDWIGDNKSLFSLPKGIYYLEVKDKSKGICYLKIGL